MNPLLALSRAGTFAKGMVNKFNADAELLDDLSDHWTAKDHKACHSARSRGLLTH